MASAAEERIRTKAEAALRAARPEARIIHELVLWQGGPRIDLAAVWPDGIILAEVKSENDTLSRLRSQLKAAKRLECEIWLCLAEKWRDEIAALEGMQDFDVPIEVKHKGRVIGTSYAANPAFMPELRSATVCWERDDGIGLGWRRPVSPAANGPGMLDMLWADELRKIAGTHPRDSRTLCINRAKELMTGREVRQACCAALLKRSFPRADPPVDVETKGAMKLA